MRARSLTLLGIAAALAAALGCIGIVPIQTASRDEIFEIPKGTWARRMSGDKVEILPDHIRLTLGLRDILVLRNHDDVPQIFGPTLMMPGQSFRLPFERASEYQFACTAHVLTLTDGKFTLTGPMGAGNPGNLGPSALIDIDGVRVVVVSRKMQALDQAIIRHLGVEPATCAILALKSSVHFRADFAPIAEQVIVAIAPGPVVADPAVLNFRHVRAEVRRRPRSAPYTSPASGGRGRDA